MHFPIPATNASSVFQMDIFPLPTRLLDWRVRQDPSLALPINNPRLLVLESFHVAGGVVGKRALPLRQPWVLGITVFGSLRQRLAETGRGDWAHHAYGS